MVSLFLFAVGLARAMFLDTCRHDTEDFVLSLGIAEAKAIAVN